MASAVRRRVLATVRFTATVPEKDVDPVLTAVFSGGPGMHQPFHTTAGDRTTTSRDRDMLVYRLSVLVVPPTAAFRIHHCLDDTDAFRQSVHLSPH